jgi:hypothetical protein
MYKKKFDQASDKSKDQKLAKIFKQMSFLISNGAFDEAKDQLNNEIFHNNLDEEEVNNYLMLINRIIEEMIDQRIDFIKSIKEDEIALLRTLELSSNEESNKKEIANADYEKKKAHNNLLNNLNNLNLKETITILATIIT